MSHQHTFISWPGTTLTLPAWVLRSMIDIRWK